MLIKIDVYAWIVLYTNTFRLASVYVSLHAYVYNISELAKM